MKVLGYTANILNQTELERFWPGSSVLTDSYLALHQVQIIGVATPGIWQLDVTGDRIYNVTISAQTELKTHALFTEKGTYSFHSTEANSILIQFSMNKLIYTKLALLDFVHFTLR